MPAHPDVARSVVAIARLDELEGRFAVAADGYRDGLERFRRAGLDDSTAELRHTLFGQATAAHAAEPVLREAIERFVRLRGDQDEMTLRNRVQLGVVLRDRGRAAEAETEALILPSFRRLESDRGVADAQTQVALRELVTLYEGSGRAAEAARYRALLVSAPARR